MENIEAFILEFDRNINLLSGFNNTISANNNSFDQIFTDIDEIVQSISQRGILNNADKVKLRDLVGRLVQIKDIIGQSTETYTGNLDQLRARIVNIQDLVGNRQVQGQGGGNIKRLMRKHKLKKNRKTRKHKKKYKKSKSKRNHKKKT